MSTVSSPAREITVAHSPDSDDAFMFYGLATNKVRVPGLKFSHTLCDIETLNRQAQDGVYDVTAISFHAFPYIQENYSLMSCGGSVGEGYGPMLVSTRPFTQDEIKQKKIAVPGKLTTAYLALELFAPGIRWRLFPSIKLSRRFSKANTKPASSFMRGSSLTTNRDCTASSISAGGGRKSLVCRCRLGGMPYGVRSGAKRWLVLHTRCTRVFNTPSIIAKRRSAYAMQFARDLDSQLADKFVGMYVNERTLDYGDDGREAVRRLLDMGHKAGIIPQTPRVEWV